MFSGASPPSTDEVEVTVFGPGYGESIVAHIGDGEWIIVDSCHDEIGRPVARTYLDSIGVRPDQVKYLVVSHWHDDHTRGISELANYYSSARIGVSTVLNTREGKIFSAAYSGEVTELTRGTKELYTIFLNHKHRIDALSQHTLLMRANGGNGCFVQALSPTSECFFEASHKIRQATPQPGQPSPIKEASQFSPNNEAVVIHIDAGQFSMLLGSDLETDNHGWTTLVNHPGCGTLRPADLYKVAHHGSATAEHDKIWQSLLTPAPVSVLTPFHHGSVKLPKEADKQRIHGRSQSLHTSSQASIKPAMDAKVARRLLTMGSNPIPLNTKLGGVRSRRNLADMSGPQGWSFSYFGAAGKLVA